MDKKILDKFDYTPEIPAKVENKVTKKGIKSSQIYFEQLLCLFALAIIAFWNSGPRVAVLVPVSVLGAVLMDMAGCALTKKIYNPLDLSTVTAGMCIALLASSGISYALAFFGSALTIGVKHVFGGKDNYIFNPAATVFAFLIICYPGKMLLFPKPREHLPVFGEINPALLSERSVLGDFSVFDILMGYFSGPIGTVHILVLLVCGICLLFRRSLSSAVTLSALGANLLFSGVLTDESGILRSSLSVLVSGYFLFILIFLANDPQTLPKTFLGKIYYGVAYGGLIVIFRTFGKVGGAPAFALLLINALSETSDKAADGTIAGIKKAVIFAKNRLNSYERIREKAKTGDEGLMRPELYDTQEIPIVQQDYNMPAIDNKIIKVKRKKQNFLKKIIEKIEIAAENRKTKRKEKTKDKEKHPLDFIENLKEGVVELGDAFKIKPKIEAAPTTAETDEGGLTPLELSLLIDDDDVVEVGASRDEYDEIKIEIIDDEDEDLERAKLADELLKPKETEALTNGEK